MVNHIQKPGRGYNFKDFIENLARPNSTGPNPKFKVNSQSIVLIIQSRNLSKIDPGHYVLRAKPLYKKELFPNATLAPEFPGYQDLSASLLGIGVLIRENVVATTASTFFPPDRRVDFSKIRFAYVNPLNLKQDPRGWIIPTSNVTTAKSDNFTSNLHRITQTGLDWALIQLEPATFTKQTVVGIAEEPVQFEQEVYQLGYHLGLPLRIDLGGTVVQYQNNHAPFGCQFSNFPIAPGAPIFDLNSHKLLGMVIRPANRFMLSGKSNDLKLKLLDQKFCLYQDTCQTVFPLLQAMDQYNPY